MPLSSRLHLRSSVEAAGLQWEGRAHSAIVDATNTARCDLLPNTNAHVETAHCCCCSSCLLAANALYCVPLSCYCLQAGHPFDEEHDPG